MTLLLGGDTGGTYTDAVLIRNEVHVIDIAKFLTTQDDLVLGIGALKCDIERTRTEAQDACIDPLSQYWPLGGQGFSFRQSNSLYLCSY